MTRETRTRRTSRSVPSPAAYRTGNASKPCLTQHRTPAFWSTTMAARHKALGISVEEAAADRAGQIPARRFGEPEEVGEACVFLYSTQAGYITGQNLLLDGGVFESAF